MHDDLSSTAQQLGLYMAADHDAFSEDSENTLLTMLIVGFVLIVVGMIVVMAVV